MLNYPIKGRFLRKKPIPPRNVLGELDNAKKGILNTNKEFTSLETKLIETVDVKLAEVDTMVDTVEETINTFVDESEKELEELKNEVIDKVNSLEPQIGTPGQDGKDADEQKIVQEVVAIIEPKIPEPIDIAKLTKDILSQVPKLDTKKLSQVILKALPENKASLKIIQQKIEVDPISIIEKILTLKGKFKLKMENIDGLSQTISAFQNQLGRGYLHGGGDTVIAGTNITITTNSAGKKVISSSNLSLVLQTNSTPNGSQALLNLTAGNNITLADDGFGKITITALTTTGTVTSVGSSDASITVTNASTTPNLIVATAPAGTLTGTTLNSTIVTSSLTIIGTLTNLTVTNAPTFSAMTAGSVLFAGTAGLLSQQTGAGQQLFWDNTNFRLGIGTAAPAKSLDVVGEGRFTVSGNNKGLTLVKSGISNFEMFAGNTNWTFQTNNFGSAFTFDGSQITFQGSNTAAKIGFHRSTLSALAHATLGATSPGGGWLFSTSDWVGGVAGTGISFMSGAATGNTTVRMDTWNSGAAGVGNLIINESGGKVGIGSATAPTKLFSVGGNLWQADLNGVQWNNNVQTTYTGSVSGTAVWSMPFQGSAYKKFIIFYNALHDAGGTITFPTAFTVQPTIYGDTAATGITTANTTTLTIALTALTSGFAIIEGY